VKRISLDELFRRAVDVLERERVPYLVYGGMALPAWGEVVTTEDIDFVVQVREESAARLVRGLREAGFQVPPSAEATLFIDAWFVASLEGREVDFALGATEFDESALERAVRVRLYERTVPIATAEDLILYKLAAYRPKDLVHVRDIVLRQGARLDCVYLRGWARRIAEATGKFEIPGTLEQVLSEQGL
jgi:hypothetical protein